MGGQIGVDSTPGQGSTFWFTAEFEKQSRPAVGQPAGRRPACRQSPDRRRQRHQPQDSEAPDSVLGHDRHRSRIRRACARAAARRARPRASPYDLAILDLMMPGMDGFELAGAIKADPSIAAVALVLLTVVRPARGRRTGAAGRNRRLSQEAGPAIAAVRLPGGGDGGPGGQDRGGVAAGHAAFDARVRRAGRGQDHLERPHPHRGGQRGQPASGDRAVAPSGYRARRCRTASSYSTPSNTTRWTSS